MIQRSLSFDHNFLNFKLVQPDFFFCKQGYPTQISISKVPITLIELNFMHLYHADVWQIGGMNTATVAMLGQKHEWGRWLL